MCQPVEIHPHEAVDPHALDRIFDSARSHGNWLEKAVPTELLQQLYDLVKQGPTSANCSPARFVFLTTPAGKAPLIGLMAEGNRAKTEAAPVTVLVAYDTEFYEKLPQLFPFADARSWYVGKPAFIEEAGFRNGTLQGGYMILAARALGLDCGPMSGFDAAKVNEQFFPDGKWKINFICNLGYGDESKLHPRAPRLSFDEACLIR